MSQFSNSCSVYRFRWHSKRAAFAPRTLGTAGAVLGMASEGPLGRLRMVSRRRVPGAASASFPTARAPGLSHGKRLGEGGARTQAPERQAQRGARAAGEQSQQHGEQRGHLRAGAQRRE